MTLKTIDEKLYDLFSELDQKEDFPIHEIKQRIAIISTPRCGSSLFCDILGNTEKFGQGKEWFNLRYINAYAKYFNLKNVNLDEYIGFVFRKTTSSNGVFVINFHVSQYMEMLKNKFDILSLNFDKIYYLSRKDKIAQAFSYARAKATDQWSNDVKAIQDNTNQITKEQVLQALYYIVSSDSYFENHLKSHIDHIYYYEDFSDIENTSVYSDVLFNSEILDYELTWKTKMEKQQNYKIRNDIVDFKKYLCNN